MIGETFNGTAGAMVRVTFRAMVDSRVAGRADRTPVAIQVKAHVEIQRQARRSALGPISGCARMHGRARGQRKAQAEAPPSTKITVQTTAQAILPPTDPTIRATIAPAGQTSVAAPPRAVMGSLSRSAASQAHRQAHRQAHHPAHHQARRQVQRQVQR